LAATYDEAGRVPSTSYGPTGASIPFAQRRLGIVLSWQGVHTGAGVAASTQTSEPVLQAATPPLIAVDEVYERALRVALQVIVVR
jgi:hypothetical protein